MMAVIVSGWLLRRAPARPQLLPCIELTLPHRPLRSSAPRSANALRSKDSKSVNVSFGSKSNEEKLQMASN